MAFMTTCMCVLVQYCLRDRNRDVWRVRAGLDVDDAAVGRDVDVLDVVGGE